MTITCILEHQSTCWPFLFPVGRQMATATALDSLIWITAVSDLVDSDGETTGEGCESGIDKGEITCAVSDREWLEPMSLLNAESRQQNLATGWLWHVQYCTSEQKVKLLSLRVIRAKPLRR
jgi:hypothetical protein